MLVLKARKLLISRYARNAKIVRNAQFGYAAVTRTRSWFSKHGPARRGKEAYQTYAHAVAWLTAV